MDRVVVLGRGGAGKSVLSRRLGALIGAPVVELDQLFWLAADLRPLAADEWERVQLDLVARPRWVADGDLGPYDVLPVRLRRADTVVVLDYSLPRCAWRALRRSRENLDFWRWVIAYRRRWLPRVLAQVRACGATVHVLRTPRATDEWLSRLPGRSG